MNGSSVAEPLFCSQSKSFIVRTLLATSLHELKPWGRTLGAPPSGKDVELEMGTAVASISYFQTVQLIQLLDRTMSLVTSLCECHGWDLDVAPFLPLPSLLLSPSRLMIS